MTYQIKNTFGSWKKICMCTQAASPLRTKTVHKTKDPEFNETLAWFHVTMAEHSRKTLHVVIYGDFPFGNWLDVLKAYICITDEDKCGDEALGAARVHLSRVTPGQTCHFNMFLEKPYPVSWEINSQKPAAIKLIYILEINWGVVISQCGFIYVNLHSLRRKLVLRRIQDGAGFWFLWLTTRDEERW